jgi:hypothetical protein
MQTICGRIRSADFVRVHGTFQFIALAAVGVAIAAVAAETGAFSFKPKDGFVPTREVAIKIAVAVWEPIYGAEQIAGERPYQARLTNGVWIVEGSLPRGTIGGVAEVEISKDDGRILRVSHGQ